MFLTHNNFGDYMLNSIWETDCQLPKFKSLNNDISTDVLIVGGGIAGILCSYFLKNAGINSVIIDSNSIANGVTKYTTAKITSQHGLIYHKLLKKFGEEIAYLYWEANETAIENYRTLAKEIECDFEFRDNYIYSTKSEKNIAEEINALEKLNIPYEFTSTTELPFDVKGAVKFRNQAQFNPYKFIKTIAKDLDIYENTRAKEFSDNTVITDRGNIKAKKIIIATHFPIINKHGFYFMKMFQHRSYVMALKNALILKGMYLDESSNGLSFRNYKDLLIVGGGGHHTGEKTNGWNDIKDFTTNNFKDSIVHAKWATQDCITLDGIPYIGRYSNSTKDLYVATGFNKWGMTSSMVAGKVLCNIIMGNEDPLINIYSPSRTILRKQLFINSGKAMKNLISIKKPKCPHLGCTLKWNKYERSWDCPCHGSRFSESGKLLNEPATNNLKIKFPNLY